MNENHILNENEREAPPCNPDAVEKERVCSGAPLSMVYSPDQQFRRLYGPEEALAHGSLFEELYKPVTTACGTGKA